MGAPAVIPLFVKKWKKQQGDILKTLYPQLTGKQVDDYLDKEIKKHLKNPVATLHNNYIKNEKEFSLLNIYEWFHKAKPIGGGFGVFFKNQNDEINPAATMIINMLDLRKIFKDMLKQFKEESYEYQTYDRYQGTEKTNVNSYYGAGGAPTSNFFNIYTATSVTATGQSLISTTEQAFEAFMSNNNPFMDLDECIFFLQNIRYEKHDLDDRFLPNISIEMVLERLSGMFYEYKESYEDILFKYLISMPQNILNRIYYKNNLYEFSALKKIRYKLTRIMETAKEFKNPNRVPDEIKDQMDDLWDHYKEFVFYNNFSFDRIEKLKNDTRKTVVVVDTDSNMLNLNPWVEFLDEYVVSVNPRLMQREDETLLFIAINMICYVLTNMITDVLYKYGRHANIPKRFRPRLNMKNEYLFTRLILSNVKKRYASSIRLKEGKEIYPEKLDIKGFDFTKTSTREDSEKYFKNIVKTRLFGVNEIDISAILRDLEKFENIINVSLRKGEKNFLIPCSVKEIQAYKNPYREQGVRGITAWNYIYPNNIIELPEKIDLIKVTLDREENLEKLKVKYPEIYKSIKDKILKNPNEEISSKGVKIIALPRTVQSIPEWIMDFIDYDTIVHDNIAKFHGILHSLGLSTLRVTKKEYFSNILYV